jgi:hypothetical protein
MRLVVLAAWGAIACGGGAGTDAAGALVDAAGDMGTEAGPLPDGSDSDTDADSSIGVDAQDGGAPDGDGSALSDVIVACGDASCAPGQFCMYDSPGVAPPCTSLNDAGGCTAPAMYMASCPSTGGRPGCFVEIQPWPIGCIDVPAACTASTSCSCLSKDPCMQGCPCGVVQQGSVLCGCP